jgi:hypothetical protein
MIIDRQKILKVPLEGGGFRPGFSVMEMAGGEKRRAMTDSPFPIRLSRATKYRDLIRGEYFFSFFVNRQAAGFAAQYFYANPLSAFLF